MLKLEDKSGSSIDKALVDGFGRVARKLRLSVTDRCNMQCIYCMPRDMGKNDKFGSNNSNSIAKRWLTKDEVLNYEEFLRISHIMARLGIEKIRVTGGEPLLRPRVEDLIAGLSKICGIRSVSMTTNGLYLGEKADLLKKNGLQSVNISLDTFKAGRFKAMCGINGLHKVLNSIYASENAGLKVKINTVVVRGWNEDEVVDFARFARETGHIVRFIEFMPLDGSGIWSPDLVVSKSEIISRIRNDIGDIEAYGIGDNNDVKVNDDDGSAPAKLYSFTDGKGTVGFIPSMTEPFCTQCDRMRITSDGRLLTCLFENPGHDIKNLLRNGKTDQEIADYILESTRRKPEGVVSIIRSKTLKPTLNLMHTIGG
ncbi:MAG: GTP 3',8-cyclase MoaA [Thermoproteota archaeon]|nr:GTP 3',8-cyclase MoaA [Thermoproteota archaeon]